MCGLIGLVSKQKTSSEISRLFSTILHRGPDSNGIYEKKFDNFNLSFAHSRLSILDTSSKGHQPMCFKNYVLVFNGEIYNFKSIRIFLENKGYIFKSNTDTEVILKSFDYWGIKCVENFDGMFAFSIFDTTKKILYLFRDRFGVKPIYYFFNKNNLMFSSEAKSIMKSSFFSKELNNNAVKDYFNLGYLRNDQRIFKDLKILSNSTCIQFRIEEDIKKIKEEVFTYKSKNCIFDTNKEGQALDTLNEILMRSCQKRLISDVPVGYFLSGGIDSSLISAIIKKNLKKDIPAFTLADKVSGNLDFEYSQKISSFLKLNHYFFDVKDYKKSFCEIFENLSHYVDEPFADISTISTIILSREVKKKVKVVISGDGADEMFGGYPKYNNIIYFFNKFKKNKLLNIKIFKIINLIISKYQNFDNLKLKKLITHLANCDEKKLLDIYNSVYLPPKYFSKLFANNMPKEEYETSNDDLSYSKLLAEDQNGYLIDNILFKLDRSTMACGLEGREPYLDHEVKEFSDFHSKYEFFRNKNLLKKIHKRYFGNDEYNYKVEKQGFVSHYSNVINEETKKFTDKLFDKDFIKKQGIFNSGNLEKIYKKNIKRENDYKLIYLISCFQSWYQKWM